MTTLSEKLLTEAEENGELGAAKTGKTGPDPSAPVLSVREVRISDQAAGHEIVHGVSFTLTPGKAVGSSASPAAGRPSPAVPRWASCPPISRSPVARSSWTAMTSRP